MSVQRSVQLLTVVAALAALAACSSYGGPRHQPDGSVVAVQWDSGPLDRDYQRQRGDMDTRHTDELANPRANESSDQRSQRQASESKDLDSRYADAKTAHADHVPPAQH
jgi:predicted small lipoprotein YifL